MQKYKIELMSQLLLWPYNQHIFSNDQDLVTEIGQVLFQESFNEIMTAENTSHYGWWQNLFSCFQRPHGTEKQILIILFMLKSDKLHEAPLEITEYYNHGVLFYSRYTRSWTFLKRRNCQAWTVRPVFQPNKCWGKLNTSAFMKGIIVFIQVHSCSQFWNLSNPLKVREGVKALSVIYT